MARKEDESRVRLQVDGKQAINELGKLEMEAKELSIDLKNAKKGTEEYVNANKRLKEVKGRIGEVRKELGLAGMTMTQLSRYQRELRKELSNTATRGTADYKRLKAELNQVNATLRTQRAELNGTSGAFKGMTGNIIKTAGAFGIFFGGMQLINQFRNLLGTANEFEQAMSNLSAITGATGDDLQYLSDKAREMGATTTLSAQQTAEAFEIIASKKPELLDNVQALTETTEATILLAEAAGIDLPTAAGALTNTLNQFGEGAEMATRFVNVLAAGSKFGAGNIEFLNDAVKRFGPIADTMNISLEQSVAMMEVFAEKGIESEKAGTQFRNILLTLASGADETNPAIVGLEKAIENLGKQNLSTAEQAKLFGAQNVLAGQIMIQSGERFAEFTQKVTGTDVALEQARARVDNMKGDMKSLGSITQEYAIIIGGLISKGLRPVVQGLTAFLLGLKELPNFIRENKGILITFVSALVAFNSAQIISTGLLLKDIAVKKIQMVWTTATTVAQRGLNAAMTANPIGLIIKATALLVSGFALLYNSSQRVRGAVAGIGEVAATVWEIIKETFGNFAGAFSKILSGDVLGGMKDLGTAIIKANPLALAINEGKRLGGAFMKGYNERINMEDAKKLVQAEGDLTTGTGGGMSEGGDSDDPAKDPSGVPGDPEKAKEKLDQMAAQWETYLQKVRDLTRQHELAGMGEEQRELEQVWDRYDTLEEELIQHLINKNITEEEFVQKAKEIEELKGKELADIRAKWDTQEAEARKEAEQKIMEATMEEKELARMKVNEHYDELLEMARKFGLATVGLEEARRAELIELEKKYNTQEVESARAVAEAKTMIARSLGQALGSVIDFVGAKSGELSTFEKVLVGAQIAMDTAASLSRIVPLAADAASGSGPAAPLVFAGYIAAMGATALTAIAKAKQALSDSSVPDWNSNSKEAKSPRQANAPVSSFFMGGDTGSGSMGFGDQYGPYAGYVHPNEYVVPSFIRSHPYVADVMPAIEAIRQEKVRGFYRGGDTGREKDTGTQKNAHSTATKTDPEMISLLRSIDGKLDRMPKKIKAYLVYNDFQETRDEIEGLEKKYMR